MAAAVNHCVLTFTLAKKDFSYILQGSLLNIVGEEF